MDKDTIAAINHFLQCPAEELTADKLLVRKTLADLSVRREQLKTQIQSQQQALQQSTADLLGVDASVNTMMQLVASFVLAAQPETLPLNTKDGPDGKPKVKSKK